MRIEYQPVDEAHIEPAVQLVLSAYREEKQAVPCLPAAEYFPDKLRTLIANLFARGSGFAAVSDGELTGFLAGFETGELWGRNKGIYSPLYGHGAVSENRSSVYQGLYTRAAEMWVQKQHFTHALTLFAHDQEIIDAWFWLGFGMRCVDSIREALPIQVGNPDPAVTIRKGGLADIPALRSIETQFANYWPQAPNFMSQEGIDSVQSYTDWFTEPNRHFWVAYLEGEAVGQIRIQPQ